MAGKFLSFQKTAAKLIRKNGTKMTVTHTVEGDLDPVTDERTDQEVPTEYDAVAIPPSQQARYRVGNLEGRNVLEFYFALEGQARAPGIGDRVATPQGTYTLFYAQTFDPAFDGAIVTIAYGER